MQHKIKKYLFDIKTSIESIYDYLGDKRDFCQYQNDKKLRRAVERELEIIGEAANRILQIDKDFPLENARKIVDLRNWVIHGYDKVDDVIIWGIISNHLPILKKQIEELKMKSLNEITIGIANDHAGVEMKFFLMEQLKNKVKNIINFGANINESVDYPDFAHPLSIAVEKGECDFGIAICGTGNGITMTVNKHQGIRAALCWEPEIAKLAREHNNANIVGIPARFISNEKALEIVKTFLTTDFAGGRHTLRIKKMNIF